MYDISKLAGLSDSESDSSKTSKKTKAVADNQRDHKPPRRKEADTVELSRMPDQFSEMPRWKNDIRRRVTAASHDPARCTIWITAVEEAKCMEALIIEKEFESLDYKLAVAVLKVAPAEAKRRIENIELQMLKEYKRPLMGRQMLWICYVRVVIRLMKGLQKFSRSQAFVIVVI